MPLVDPPATFQWLPRWAWMALLGFIIGVYVLIVATARPHFDAAWFAEEAWWLYHDGVVRSELFRGINGWEKQMFVFHKLYIYCEAVIFRLFGFTPGTCQLVALLGTLAGLAALLRYLRPAPVEHRWLAVVLYVGCGSLLRYGVSGRPEALVMALGFSSFVVLAAGRARALPTGQAPGFGRLVGAGALAGAAALAHLNGLAFIVAGAGWLLLRPGRGLGWRPALVFGVVASTVTAFYLADALLAHQLPTLVAQFRFDPATRHSFTIGSRFAILLELHKLFFHSDGEVTLSVLVLGGALLLWPYGSISRQQPATRYALLLIGTFCLLTKNIADYYYLLFVPSLIVLLLEWLAPATARRPRYLAPVIRFVAVAYTAMLLPRAQFIWNEHWRTPADLIAYNAAMARYMPLHGTNVIAPLNFIFGQMPNYRIRSLTSYAIRNTFEWHDTLSVRGFFHLADQDSIQYVLTDIINESHNIIIPVPASAPARIGRFQRVYQDAWGAVYAHDQWQHPIRSSQLPPVAP